ncbi:MAG: hypothetical protein M3083_23195 [Actinomycetota bacterium]|nr:hypothetical protein [Actinomycetota bacterium]
MLFLDVRGRRLIGDQVEYLIKRVYLRAELRARGGIDRHPRSWRPSAI